MQSLMRRPAYSVPAIAILALSTAVALVVFAVVDEGLLKPLPYRHRADLYRVFGEVRGQQLSVAAADSLYWSQALPEVGFTLFQLGEIQLNGVGRPLAAIDTQFCHVLGIALELGSCPQGGAPTQGRVQATISYSSWRRDFQSRRDVLGTVVRTGDGLRSLEIVGVLAPEFVFPDDCYHVDVLVPLVISPQVSANRNARRFRLIVRKVPAWSETVFTERLQAVVQARRDAGYSSPFDAYGSFERVAVFPLRDFLGRRVRAVYLLFSAGVALLVALAWTNICALSLSYAQERALDTAIRSALGARSRQIWAGIALESSLLVFTGEALGYLLGSWLLPYVVSHLPSDAPFSQQIALGGREIAFLLLTGGIAVAAVSFPVWSFSRRVELSRMLGSRVVATRQPWSRVLVAVQVAVSFVLLLAAVLGYSSLRRVWGEEAGIALDGVARLELTLTGPRGTRLASAMDVLRHIRLHSGVEAATVVDASFLDGTIGGSPFELPPGARDDLFPEMLPVSSQFFATTHLRLISGRLLDDLELDRGASVVVVSKRIASSFWPDGPALGQELVGRLGRFSVVGIVDDARLQALDREPSGEIYIPLGAVGVSPKVTVLIRSQEAVDSLVPALVNGLRQVNSSASMASGRAVRELMGDTIRHRRFRALVAASLGLTSALIAALGIFAASSAAANRRIKETGIRMVLGATPARAVIELMMTESIQVMVGLALGAAAAWRLAAATEPFLYKIRSLDGPAWVVATTLLVATASIGLIVPCAKTLVVDPADILRRE